MPQERNIFKSLTVEENLTAVATPGAWTVEKVYDMFPRLRERRGNLGTQLSGGEQQMLTIGRALMTNPDLLILDEATEGLAPLVAKEIWSIIRLIRQDGIAAIIVDKNFTAVSAIADRVVVLVKGRVAFAGSAADLKAQPEILQKHLGV